MFTLEFRKSVFSATKYTFRRITHNRWQVNFISTQDLNDNKKHKKTTSYVEHTVFPVSYVSSTFLPLSRAVCADLLRILRSTLQTSRPLALRRHFFIPTNGFDLWQGRRPDPLSTPLCPPRPSPLHRPPPSSTNQLCETPGPRVS